jgi:hypothetical protein
MNLDRNPVHPLSTGKKKSKALLGMPMLSTPGPGAITVEPHGMMDYSGANRDESKKRRWT